MESCVWTFWKLPRNFVTTLRWQVLIALVCRKRKKEKRRVLCEVSGADTGDSPACSWTGRPGCLAEETEMRVPGTATARRRGQNHHRHYISSSLSLWPGCVAAAARTPSNGLDGWGWGTASWPPSSPCPPTPTPALCHTVSGEAVIIICYYYHHPSVASRECSLWQWSWSRAPAPSWYLTTQALATSWLWDPRVGLQPRQWGNVSIISHILAWMLHNSRRHSQCTLMAHTSTRPQPVTIFSSSPRLQVNLKSRPNGKWKLGWSPIVVCSQWFKPWNATFELGFIIYRHTFSATKNDIIFQLAINKPTSFCSASCNTYNNLIWICTFSVDAFIFCSRVHLQTPAASVWEHERGGQWEGETLKEAQTTGI